VEITHYKAADTIYFAATFYTLHLFLVDAIRSARSLMFRSHLPAVSIGYHTINNNLGNNIIVAAAFS
jgi:hypothetical protein